MRFEQLQCLQEIARTGSITVAAEKLYISQQAVSKSIKQLEEELGAPLIMRTKNGVVLTELGAKATVVATHILDARDYLIHGMEKALDVYAQKRTAVYNICSNSVFLTTLSPVVYAQLNCRMEYLNQVNSAEKVVEQVLAGQSDLGLITISSEKWQYQLENNPQMRMLTVELLEKDRIVCVKGKRYYSWEQNHISWTEFCIRQKTFYNLNGCNAVDIDNNFIRVPQQLGLHYNLMDQNGVLTLMPELVYRRFFSDKRFMSVLIEDVPPTERIYQPILHLAICRNADREQIEPLMVMLRREVHKR